MSMPENSNATSDAAGDAESSTNLPRMTAREKFKAAVAAGRCRDVTGTGAGFVIVGHRSPRPKSR